MLAANAKFLGDERAPDPIGVRDVLEMGTVDGARANGLGGVVGRLTPGLEADMIAISAEAINTMPLNDAIGTVVSGCDSRNVEWAFVAGLLRKWRGEVIGVDPPALRNRVTSSRDAILARAGRPLRTV